MRASTFFRRTRIAVQAVVDITNWDDVLPFAARGREVTKIHLRNGAVIIAPPETALWPHFSDVWYHSSYTRYCPIPRGATVVDVGANVGVFSLFAARVARCVYAIEPASSNFSLMAQNVGLAKNVIPLRYACAARDGKGMLSLVGPPVAFSLKTLTSEGQAESVDLISLETLFEKWKITKCDYLKLDCEGAEFEIILNSRPSVFDRVSRIVMEYHDHLSDGPSHRDLVLKLQSLGFRTKEYKTNGTYGMLAGVRP